MEMDDREKNPKELVQKFSVLKNLETEATVPKKKGNTLYQTSWTIRSTGGQSWEDSKAVAQEKNYYRGVLKCIYPTEWHAFLNS
jgi:hypothetical protein